MLWQLPNAGVKTQHSIQERLIFISASQSAVYLSSSGAPEGHPFQCCCLSVSCCCVFYKCRKQGTDQRMDNGVRNVSFLVSLLVQIYPRLVVTESYCHWMTVWLGICLVDGICSHLIKPTILGSLYSDVWKAGLDLSRRHVKLCWGSLCCTCCLHKHRTSVVWVTKPAFFIRTK